MRPTASDWPQWQSRVDAPCADVVSVCTDCHASGTRHATCVPNQQRVALIFHHLLGCSVRILKHGSDRHAQGIIPVEGLLLEEVPPGLHQLHCLPMKLVGSDGAPCRCIIIVS